MYDQGISLVCLCLRVFECLIHWFVGLLVGWSGAFFGRAAVPHLGVMAAWSAASPLLR
jgi:hypothetical protein